MDGPGNHFYMKLDNNANTMANNNNDMNSTNPFRRPRTARPMTMIEPNWFPVNPFDDPIPQTVNTKKRMSTPNPKGYSNLQRSNSQYNSGKPATGHYSSRKGRVRPDVIDRLDDVADFQYHHEGPYDAVYPERNRNSKKSPVEALKESNEMALKATHPDQITDSLRKHRPLDGVAFFPPGTTDREGHTYNYDEGSNMVAEEYGHFLRMPPGFKFTEEDFKNDPFYKKDFQPKRRISIRKAFGFGRSRKIAA